MKVFAALLIDGVEDGPRVPADIHFAQPHAENFSSFAAFSVENPVTLGPASRGGVATIGFFFSDDETSNCVLEARTKTALLAGQSLTYEPS